MTSEAARSLNKIFGNKYSQNYVNYSIQIPYVAGAIWGNESLRITKPAADRGLFDRPRKLTDLFPEIDATDTHIKCEAERYSTGRLGHAGGGRVGNSGPIQLKGIGPNMLVSERAPLWYSYGQMNLIDGAIECVISNILQKLNSAFCKGVIALCPTTKGGALYCHGATTDKLLNGGHQDFESAWGGILVRHPEIRPAHFMRSPLFSREEARKKNIISDHTRIRLIWQQISKLIGSADQANAIFVKFGEMILDTMAFARSCNILHGGMTHSNITMSGGWLDLNTVHYLPEQVEFENKHNEETTTVMKAIQELMFYYSKYSLTLLDISNTMQSLGDYYYSQCKKYCEIRSGKDELTNVRSHSSPDITCKTLKKFKMEALVSVLEKDYLREWYNNQLHENGMRELYKSVSGDLSVISWLLTETEGDNTCRLALLLEGGSVFYCGKKGEMYMRNTHGEISIVKDLSMLIGTVATSLKDNHIFIKFFDAALRELDKLHPHLIT